MWNVQ